MFKGKFVGLRAVERSDLPKLMEWRNNPEYRKFFREYVELNSDMQEKWYLEKILSDKNTIMFSVIDIKTLNLLGICGLCYINWVHRNADFSIYIGAKNLYIDEKFAPDVANLLINYAFNDIGLHRLWTEIYDFDEKKKQFFEKLNFKLEGICKQTYWHDGKWNDSLFYGFVKGY